MESPQQPHDDGRMSPPPDAPFDDEAATDADAAPHAAEPRMSRGAAWLAMGAVALALLLVYLAPGAGDADHDDVDRIVDAAMVGKPAPLHYTLKDMHGVDVKLESFKGKVILVNFWATWCPPCKVEIPDLVALQQQYADDLVVLGFSTDDSPEDLKKFAAEYRINYPLLVGSGREDVQDAFGPSYGIPVSVFIDRNGMIAERFSRMATKEQFEQVIKPLL